MDIPGFDNKATANDMHTVDVIDPSIEVSKTGPETGKVGDEITYTICLENPVGPIENCTGDDNVLGDLGGFDAGGECKDFMYTLPESPGQVENTATITCDIPGLDNKATANDMHTVDVIDPSIEVSKTGPEEAKAGDEITYTICLNNPVGPLGVCTGTDPLFPGGDGNLGEFDTAGECKDFMYTIPGDAEGSVDNTASISCTIPGFDNTADASDNHTVDLFTVSAEMSKMCEPDPVNVGDDIEWTITIDNTGDKELDCMVNDPTAELMNAPLTVPAGTSDSLTASRTVVLGDAPVISNTATASCSVDGFDNVIDGLEATADCEVQSIVEICRTPGFWKNRSGDQDHPRSTNLTQLVIDAAGGSIDICGRSITNTNLNSVNSALEAMCVSIEGIQQRQLARQLMAAALNCVVSGGDSMCNGISIESEFQAANAACTANAGDLSFHIGVIDDFNNSKHCHEQDLGQSEVFEGVNPLPGPAGSPKMCKRATKNDTYIVPVP